MYNIELPQNFASNLNENRHQVALLLRKTESKDENENISRGARGIQKSEIIHRL